LRNSSSVAWSSTPFGDRLDAELLCHANNRLDDLAVLFVGDQVADELPVDLEVVDRQVSEISERSVSDPEIIKGDLAAQLPDAGRKGMGRAEAIGHRGLGDLEDQILTTYTAGHHGRPDEVDLLGVRDRLG
jgi:hypothetical protein